LARKTAFAVLYYAPISAKDFRLTVIANLYNTITQKSNIKFAQLLFYFRREIPFDVHIKINFPTYFNKEYVQFSFISGVTPLYIFQQKTCATYFYLFYLYKFLRKNMFLPNQNLTYWTNGLKNDSSPDMFL
jgi:hypothetical protein